ncbi:MAG TPA: reductive dehalogenase [Desulfomonilaceae bacterium]|nr:reductive dehalogenase [Desulfomonilaceae bacterium]
MSEKTKVGAEEKATGISRRGFAKVLAGTTAAALVGAAPTPTVSASPSATAEGAEQIYQCKPELKRFSEKDIAFKKVSEELGAPWMQLWFKNMLTNVKESKIGKNVPVKSPKEARAHVAFWMAASTWNRVSGPYGEGLENKGLLSWKPMNVPPMFRGNPDPDPDPADLTKKIKQIARFVGANRVGIAKLNRKWIYEETCRNPYAPDAPQTKKIVFKDVKETDETDNELIIPETVKYAVVTVAEMNRIATQIGPTSVQSSVATNMGYARIGIIDIALAEAIRTLGYNAIPTMNNTGLSIPLAIDAGLGQLGRHGLLITPDYGAAVRIGKVLTDMPLVPDGPIDFGLTKFCESCTKCAENCPAKCIGFGERTYNAPVDTSNSGALKWFTDGRKCLRLWVESGASCVNCQAVCTYTKGSFWGHGFVRGVTNTAPQLNPLWAYMDDVFGYGQMRDPDVVWNMKMSPFGMDPRKEI